MLEVVHGEGATTGEALVRHPGPAKISFTGSPEVGERILAIAGLKRVTLELGNNSGVMVEPDADLDKAIPRLVMSAFANAGQVCLSLQRLFVHASIADTVIERLVEETKALKVGDPRDRACDVGPMISEAAADRVEKWVQAAIDGGARRPVGGRREGKLVWPTVLTHTRPEMKVMKDEVFGPVVSVVRYDTFEEGLQRLADTPYGLQAGIYTRDIEKAFAAIRRLDMGGVLINDTPIFRVDHMPYGGNRRSGIGREGVRYAVEEMTNLRMVVDQPVVARRAGRAAGAAPRRAAAPADTATLSDSTGSAIGMRTRRSAICSSASGRPAPSLPTKQAIGPRQSMASNEHGAGRGGGEALQPLRAQDAGDGGGIAVVDRRQAQHAAHRAAQRLPAERIGRLRRRRRSRWRRPLRRRGRWRRRCPGSWTSTATTTSAGGPPGRPITSSSACFGRAATATTPDGLVVGLSASITGSATWTTRTPVPASAVARRRARPSARGQRPGGEGRAGDGELCRPRLLEQVQAVEQHAIAIVAVGDAADGRDERVLAAGDDVHATVAV